MACLNCKGSGKIMKQVVTHLILCPCCRGRSYGCKCKGKGKCRYQFCSKGKIWSSDSSNTEMRRVDCNTCNGSGAAYLAPKAKDYYIDSDSDDEDDEYDLFQTEFEKQKRKHEIMREKEQQKKKRREELVRKQKQKRERQRQLDLEREQRELHRVLSESMMHSNNMNDSDDAQIAHDDDLRRALAVSLNINSNVSVDNDQDTNNRKRLQHYLALEQSMNVNVEEKEQKNDNDNDNDIGFDDYRHEKKEKEKEEDIYGYGQANNSCSICLQQYKSGDERRVLRCMHVFHVICVSQWIDKMDNRKCPICRTKVDQ